MSETNRPYESIFAKPEVKRLIEEKPKEEKPVKIKKSINWFKLILSIFLIGVLVLSGLFTWLSYNGKINFAETNFACPKVDIPPCPSLNVSIPPCPVNNVNLSCPTPEINNYFNGTG